MKKTQGLLKTHRIVVIIFSSLIGILTWKDLNDEKSSKANPRLNDDAQHHSSTSTNNNATF